MDIHFVFEYNSELISHEMKLMVARMIKLVYKQATFTMLSNRDLNVAIKFDRHHDGPIDEYLASIEHMVNTQWSAPREDEYDEEAPDV